MQTDILIVGGGLSGLALAEELNARGTDFQLVEARDRLGGRILSQPHGAAHFDMGPAWFWPGQPRIDALIDRLGLARFEQFSTGELSFEDERGQVQRGVGYASMQGSWRLEGGLKALIDALASALPPDRLHLNAGIAAVTRTDTGIDARLSDGRIIRAKRIVLALPPRIAAGIEFSPALPDATRAAMSGIATWMAGQAKAVAVYERAFWRDAGLSGDAMSRAGPMVEIHDASPAEGGPFALFGFIGVPPQARENEALLRQHLLAQLRRLFGPEAARPEALFVKDWAADLRTATEADKAPLYAHPDYGLATSMRDLWDGRVVFAGAEVAPQFGGYLEGALEAAENVLETVAGRSKEAKHAV